MIYAFSKLEIVSREVEQEALLPPVFTFTMSIQQFLHAWELPFASVFPSLFHQARLTLFLSCTGQERKLRWRVIYLQSHKDSDFGG